MNTLKIEKLLAEKYHYAPLSKELSEKYRSFFAENIPKWLCVDGADTPLYTSSGSKICENYDRIVVGDYGAFVEFTSEAPSTKFVIQPGQEYRVEDAKYKRNVKYVWMTIDDGSCIKIYKQKKTVTYADYLPKKYYISVHECMKDRGCIE